MTVFGHHSCRLAHPISNFGSGFPRQTQGAASSAPTLADVVRAFKSTSAIRVDALLGRSGQPLWQRNYYEHIIRNEDEPNKIREHIWTNPRRWASDPEFT